MSEIKQVKIGSTNYDLIAKNGVFYIEGGGTTDTTNKVATWTGSHDDITEYYNGLTIAFKVGTAGSTKTTLNINNLGAVTVVRNVNTGISTSYAVKTIVFLIYTADGSTAYWKVADYDANTRNTVGDYRKNATKLYFVGTESSDSSTTSSYATSYTNSNIYVDTSNVLYSAQGFSGDLIGNADTATKATQDASGNVIADTYATKTELSGKSDSGHTHKYAGASSSGGSATSAVKLDSSAGSSTQPVYFSGGKPVATTYTLGASVPSCAASNNGQFLRVVNGVAAWSTVPNAEEASF